MLKHLPRSGVDFLLHIFNLSWSLHSFPSTWRASSIIFIHKIGKPLDSPASFQPISLTFCISKLFERIILSRLLFFLESNSILSPRGVPQGSVFLALYFSLFSSIISLLLCLLPSAALFTLTIWSFGPPLPRSLLQWKLHKKF